MAKISSLKFQLQGKDYNINVNCTSSGQFNANLPEEVAEALRIEKKIVSKTLAELEKLFFGALKRYKEIETKEELFILISYHARGEYKRRKDGTLMFGGYRHKYNLEVNYSRPENALGLDFMVAIKQTIDKKPKWFEAILGKDCSHVQEKEYSLPDIYHKQSEISDADGYRQIPFSDIALQTLQNAQERIRSASEVLFNFIEQDEEQILLTLTNQKLLA